METQKVIEMLESNIPRDAVAVRDGGGGKKLSYLEAWYVVDRMNAIFGNLNWSMETVEMKQVDAPKPTYVAKVRIAVLLADGRLVFKDGTGWGSDKGAMNPHEMAVKEAESDAMKRAAMKFGKNLGLALYDKSGEFIDEEAPKPAKSAPKKAAPAAAEKPTQSHDELVSLIGSLARVAEAKKRKSVAEIQEYYRGKYKVNTTKELSQAQAAELVEFLRELIK